MHDNLKVDLLWHLNENEILKVNQYKLHNVKKYIVFKHVVGTNIIK